MSNSATIVALNSYSKPLPPVPTKQELLGMNYSFMGGIVINSPDYGKMPWWDPALAWCPYSTRKLVYQAKQQNQVGLVTGPETHCILEVPSGAPLYNEWNQFYSPDKFGPLDWTNRLTKLDKAFDNLVLEIIMAGFKVHIALDENFYTSLAVGKLVAQRLKDLGLSKYCVMMPGYDGIFYGWDPNWIAQWFDEITAINSDLALIMEFDPGHIPVGNGPKDFAPDGLLKNCSGILAESRWPPDNSTWGVFERCYVGYKQPPDQNIDFPPAPFYLVGGQYFNGFENDYPYAWVRIDANDDNQVQNARNELAKRRNYYRSIGSQYNG